VFDYGRNGKGKSLDLSHHETYKCYCTSSCPSLSIHGERFWSKKKKNEFSSPQDFVAQNMSVKTDLLPMVFFNGDYKFLWYYTMKIGESIGNVTLYFNLKTTNRDSFG
jgi:hypothetical protein